MLNDSGIAESGNGYIRFTNGIQICYWHVPTPKQNTAQIISYPKEFAINGENRDPPSIMVVPDINSSISTILYPVVHWSTPSDGSVSTTIDSTKEFVLYLYSKQLSVTYTNNGFMANRVVESAVMSNASNIDACYVFCTAIGRWK